ncbi:MAG TPA: 2,3-bisphosphoglycerate-independent phosphoglycerate mutase [Fastidiosipila sp.]|nr:2,3-bisphosphoglycerate-independent phosphoglycerate mutase [Fastidiosipila sp.]
MKRPLVLMILDGWGIAPPGATNAVSLATTPNLNRLLAEYPHTTLKTSGLDVGLPPGQMGNSEVGHMNIGAGRIVYQELTRISKAIEDGDFFENEAFLGAIQNCREKGTSLHLMGLLSDGGVHSHIEHLFALLELAKRHELEDVFVHAFYDGRDVSPDSGAGFSKQLLAKMDELGVGKLVSQSGRYYAMDRDNRWERTESAYRAMVMGDGRKSDDPVQAVYNSYETGVTDEFIEPITDTSADQPIALVAPHDSVIFFNFRPDRARQLTRAFMQPDFAGFALPKGPFPLHFVTMTQYDDMFESWPGIHVAFKPEALSDTFGEIVSRHGLNQLRIAETEKYAHVTFFFNGGEEVPYEGEDRALIPSPKVATYDLLPEMSAPQVTDEMISRVNSDKYDVIILNFANCDMVGHTGSIEAATRAVEAVDTGVGRIVARVLEKGGQLLITADHGNAEQMVDFTTGGQFTAHTTNPVPLLLVGAKPGLSLKDGRLADLAPTMLELLDIQQPEMMTGTSLLVSD